MKLVTMLCDPATITIPSRFPPYRPRDLNDLSESIQEHGQLQPIGITRGKDLIFGLHRLLACRSLGVKVRAEVWAVKDPVECERLSIVENLRRRTMGADELSATVTRLAAISGHCPETPPKRKPGRPPTPRKAAREEAAAGSGKSREAVKRADNRARAKAAKEAEPEPSAVPTDGLGQVLPPEIAEEYQVVTELFDAMESHVRGLVLGFGKLDEYSGNIHARRWREAAQQLGLELRQYRPYALCPYCKLAPAILKLCEQCRQSGWVGKNFYERAAPELRITGPEAVVYRPGKGVGEGEFVRVGDL